MDGIKRPAGTLIPNVTTVNADLTFFRLRPKNVIFEEKKLICGQEMTLLSFFGPFSGSEIVRGTPNTLIKLLINMFVLKTADYVNKKTNKQPEMLPCVIQFSSHQAQPQNNPKS